MPKIGKKRRDKIKEHIRKGYNNKETAEEFNVSADFAGKLRKEIEKIEPKKEKTPELTLSKEAWQKLYNLQVVLGKQNLDQTVAQIFTDVTTIIPAKYEFDLNSNFSIAQIFKKIATGYARFKKSFGNVIEAENNDWIQRVTLHAWNVDQAVFTIHDYSVETGYKGTIIDLMSEMLCYSFRKEGGKIDYYYNEELGKRMPIITDREGRKFS